jgi:hypothetical protein
MAGTVAPLDRDPDGAATIANLAALEQLVTWSKLFRRIVAYLASGFADFDGKDAGPIPGRNSPAPLPGRRPCPGRGGHQVCCGMGWREPYGSHQADEPDHGQGGHRQGVGPVPRCQVGHQDGAGDGGAQRRAQGGDAARQPRDLPLLVPGEGGLHHVDRGVKITPRPGPISSSHWMFWVTRPRLEVRLRNRLVDTSGSFPARSLARMWRKNQNRKAARQLIAVVISPPMSGPVAAPMPPIPLIRPNARAREVRLVNSSVVRM